MSTEDVIRTRIDEIRRKIRSEVWADDVARRGVITGLNIALHVVDAAENERANNEDSTDNK